MCHYITAVLPKAAEHQALDAIARKHGRQFRPLSNPGVEEFIQPTEAYFLTTLGHCDCGTPLGTRSRSSGKRKPLDLAAQEKQLRQKGWSEARISRSLSQKREKLFEANLVSEKETKKSTVAWHSLLTEVISSGKTPYVCLLLHFYSGSLQSRIEVSERIATRLSSDTADFLGMMREDVLYEFRSQP